MRIFGIRKSSHTHKMLHLKVCVCEWTPWVHDTEENIQRCIRTTPDRKTVYSTYTKDVWHLSCRNDLSETQTLHTIILRAEAWTMRASQHRKHTNIQLLLISFRADIVVWRLFGFCCVSLIFLSGAVYEYKYILRWHLIRRETNISKEHRCMNVIFKVITIPALGICVLGRAPTKCVYAV